MPPFGAIKSSSLFRKHEYSIKNTPPIIAMENMKFTTAGTADE